MNEFGSFFELSTNKGTSDIYDYFFNKSTLLLRSARECLLIIGQDVFKRNIKTVFMPALCCQSMVQPFLQLGFSINYYRLKNDLSIDMEHLRSIMQDNSLLLLINYHGIKTYNSISIKELINSFNNLSIVQDCTQHIFTESLYDYDFDYQIGSIRKWMAIPDGAFLISRKPILCSDCIINENNSFSETMYEAMKEKADYLLNGNQTLKKSFRAKNTFCMELLKGPIIPYHASELSLSLMESGFTIDELVIQRSTNYNTLFERLCDYNSTILKHTVSQECPLCFPVFINNRDKIQQDLANKGIYCQVLWPIPKEAKGICSESLSYSEHMLAIPCDQRYSSKDMDYIANTFIRVLCKDRLS